jgi:hypothetical protein
LSTADSRRADGRGCTSKSRLDETDGFGPSTTHLRPSVSFPRGNPAEIWFGSAEKHWHGGTPKTAITHIAIQEVLNGKSVDWMEKVNIKEKS